MVQVKIQAHQICQISKLFWDFSCYIITVKFPAIEKGRKFRFVQTKKFNK
jgi:hypothetical protein